MDWGASLLSLLIILILLLIIISRIQQQKITDLLKDIADFIKEVKNGG